MSPGSGLKLQAAPAAVFLPMAFTFSLFKKEKEGRMPNYFSTTANRSSSRMTSSSAIDLHGLAGYLPNRTRSPTFTAS
jgi:hypothetical protein